MIQRNKITNKMILVTVCYLTGMGLFLGYLLAIGKGYVTPTHETMMTFVAFCCIFLGDHLFISSKKNMREYAKEQIDEAVKELKDLNETRKYLDELENMEDATMH
jgi:hypothetical protein